jgi:hypothetical protein
MTRMIFGSRRDAPGGSALVVTGDSVAMPRSIHSNQVPNQSYPRFVTPY